MNIFTHLFTPHHTNNHRAKLLHHDSILIIVGFLLVGSFFLHTVRNKAPQVLGTSINISSNELLLLTNEKRTEQGLAPLQLNDQLSQAAAGKARDMFTKNYWAHFSPSGTSPWDFIKGAGYNYLFAGENLARGFSSSSDVLNAWMASPDHRANVLSKNYHDVGFAVAEGSLTGDNDTILVVEEFGSKQAVLPANTTPPVQVAALAPAPVVVKQQIIQHPLFDSATISKTITIVLLGMFLFVFALDIILTEKRKTVRVVGHSFDHMLFLGVIIAIVVVMMKGIAG